MPETRTPAQIRARERFARLLDLAAERRDGTAIVVLVPDATNDRMVAAFSAGLDVPTDLTPTYAGALCHLAEQWAGVAGVPLCALE
ncbi:hypothetical protein ACTD5D_32180 [Nocardia takedensis]|uniref:hypothetical protein n=1 Tax=Nocardia takedensis TaxID=259390 RepID=UPI003F759C92